MMAVEVAVAATVAVELMCVASNGACTRSVAHRVDVGNYSSKRREVVVGVPWRGVVDVVKTSRPELAAASSPP